HRPLGRDFWRTPPARELWPDDAGLPPAEAHAAPLHSPEADTRSLMEVRQSAHVGVIAGGVVAVSGPAWVQSMGVGAARHNGAVASTPEPDTALGAFSAPTRSWFTGAFAAPTPAQAGAWESIASGE